MTIKELKEVLKFLKIQTDIDNIKIVPDRGALLFYISNECGTRLIFEYESRGFNDGFKCIPGIFINSPGKKESYSLDFIMGR